MRLFLLIGLTVSTLAVGAQDPAKLLRLRVVDGRNGRAVANEDVNLWYDEMEGRPLVLHTNADGIAPLPPPLSPAVRVFVTPLISLDCRKTQVALSAYSLRAISETGITVENHCGSPGIRKSAGELILFVRDRRWYDGLNQ
jgi:hypothetical protein